LIQALILERLRTNPRMTQKDIIFEIPHTLCAELSGFHYWLLMKIEDGAHCEFYSDECVEAA